MNTDDVLEFLVVGAHAVELGTVQFTQPRAALEIVEQLEQVVKDEGLSHISEIVGSLDEGEGAITVEQGSVSNDE